MIANCGLRIADWRVSIYVERSVAKTPQSLTRNPQLNDGFDVKCLWEHIQRSD